MTGRIFGLLSRHQKLDEALRSEMSRPWPDPVQITQLKKRKLAIKDRLHALLFGRNLRTS